MKKLLFLFLICALASQSCKAETFSLDPKSFLFLMYVTEDYSIETTSIEGASMSKMFGSDSSLVDHTEDKIYFVLTKNYYKVWWSEENAIFVVKKQKEFVSLGDHLIGTINLIREQRKCSKK